MHSYDYITNDWRAQPLYVVDGDTVDLFVDVGFRHYATFRFRLLDIDAPELRDKNEENRQRAEEAKKMVQDLLDIFEETTTVDLAHWPLRVQTEKSPDRSGYWLARIFFTIDDVERSLNMELLRSDLAVP